ncbi:ATP-binding protein [Marinigracilibium pacificum]|uniref:AAA family ATPase n=1 Tax=Marinigracilibium pacificum TaxID=2729599 RepID=A0A848J6F2_9BACT|nr:AAA family ATPase [Marinigracilibium pacificum]NMM50044.1 AAA family ATPase [Marinigracilibium pacificum]
MKICEIHIDGFGKLNDFKLKNLSEGINLILGKNEAGKSTILKFVIYTLFGYPSTKRSQSNMEPVNGGAHGGRILVEHVKYGKIWFERYFGANGGILRVFDDNGNSYDDRNDLLYEVNESLFKNIYAITLDELSSSNSIDESGFFELLLSRSMGLRNTGLKQLREDLLLQKKKLLSSSKKSEIQLLLDEKKEVEEQREELRKSYDEYFELLAKVDNNNEKVSESKKVFSDLKLKLKQLTQIQEMYPDFVRYSDNKKKLESISIPVSFSLEDSGKAISINERINVLTVEIDNLDQELSQADIDRRELNFDDSILENQEQIERLKSNYKYLESLCSIINDERVKLTGIKKSLDKEADSLGFNPKHILKIPEVNNFGKVKSFISEYKNLKDQFVYYQASADNRLDLLQKDKGFKSTTVLTLVLIVCAIIAGIILFYKDLVIPSIGSFLVATGLTVFLIVKQKHKASIINGVLNDIKDQKQKVENFFLNFVMEELPGRQFQTLTDLEHWYSACVLLEKNIKEWIDRVKGFRQKENEIHGFEKELSLLTGAKIEKDELIKGLDKLFKKYEEAKIKERKLFQIKQTVLEKEKQWNDKLRERQDYINNLNKLFEEKGIDSNEDLLKLHNSIELRDKLIRENNEILFAFKKVFGVDNANNPNDIYKEINPADIDFELERLEKEYNEKELEIVKLYETITRDTHSAELLKKISEEVADQQATLINEELTDKVLQWYKLDYIEHIINKATINLEMAVKPAIIEDASAIFSRITEGKYLVVHESENQFISVSDKEGKRIKVEDLSRGTKEQLYLSLRLAIVKGKDEPLPLILDDILVNFDGARLRLAIDELHNISNSHQILLFSCHESMKTKLEANTIEI